MLSSLPLPFGDDWFSGFQDCKMESRRSQWSRDQVVEDRRDMVEGDGMGEEETNCTFLLGLKFAEPEPAEGVLSGERRQDFVGEVVFIGGSGVWVWCELRRSDSVQFSVRFDVDWV